MLKTKVTHVVFGNKKIIKPKKLCYRFELSAKSNVISALLRNLLQASIRKAIMCSDVYVLRANHLHNPMPWSVGREQERRDLGRFCFRSCCLAALPRGAGAPLHPLLPPRTHFHFIPLLSWKQYHSTLKLWRISSAPRESDPNIWNLIHMLH